LATWSSAETGSRIDELGGRIAVDAQSAEAVLSLLAEEGSAEAVMLRAELLVWIARAEPVKKKGSNGADAEEKPVATDRLGELAAEWLDHPDPCVRGLAEWALAIRLGAEYEGAEEKVDGRRVVREWPGDDAPA
ncbi:MAG: hypothetical protein KJZ87_25105, partial [Thermoguttaceae bacterium]|nr:hypothetical protein [Thermoguttaceae bacterium]